MPELEQNKAKQPKKKLNLFYWIPFFVCIFAMTEFFGGYKYIDDGETIKALIMIPGSIFLAILCLSIMAFQIYSEEKEKNNLKSEFYLFERIYALTNRGKNYG